jgi:hypothetical protein
MSDAIGGPFSSFTSLDNPRYKKALNHFKKNALIKLYFKTEKARKAKSELVKEDKQELALKVKEAFETLTGHPRHYLVVRNFISKIIESKQFSENRIKATIIQYFKENYLPSSEKHWPGIISKIYPPGIKETEKNIALMKSRAQKLPNKQLKITEALQAVKFRYTNSRHDPVPEVKVLDTEYEGKKGQKTYGQRKDVLGWNTNYFFNKKEAALAIDEIDSFARLLAADKKEKYNRVKTFFPEQAQYLRRYIKEKCKGVKIKHEGLWKQTDWEEIRKLDDQSF